MNISNNRPVIGVYGVNYPGSGDMYSKGANMLHTLRQIIDDDEKWRQILRGLNKEFYHQTVKAKQIEDYIIRETGLKLQPFFNQYLRDTRIPTFEYALVEGKMRYRWTNCVPAFKMKLKVFINGQMHWLEPTQRWERLELDDPISSVEVDKDFYVANFKIADLKR
jgi:aminopeptidase N